MNARSQSGSPGDDQPLGDLADDVDPFAGLNAIDVVEGELLERRVPRS